VAHFNLGLGLLGPLHSTYSRNIWLRAPQMHKKHGISWDSHVFFVWFNMEARKTQRLNELSPIIFVLSRWSSSQVPDPEDPTSKVWKCHEMGAEILNPTENIENIELFQNFPKYSLFIAMEAHRKMGFRGMSRKSPK